MTYQCGSRGPEVALIQNRLKAEGFYAGPLDGDFGGGTESAVKAFQRQSGVNPADGVVGQATWSKLFGDEPIKEPVIKGEPLNLRCLALTGSFETNTAPPECFAGLSGDFDGQGLSLGVCQWNVGRGSLQPLLHEMEQTHAAVIDSIFHDYAAEFRKMLAAPLADQLAWARSIQDARHNLSEPWRGLLKTLAGAPEFQSIQAKAAQRLFDDGLKLCADFGLTTERAAALMFDIKVQNGSINDVVKAQIDRDFQQLPSAQSADASEVARMQIVANRRAAAANPQWSEDVRTRKLTIANGSGAVHGRRYDLDAAYGIALRSLPVRARA